MAEHHLHMTILQLSRTTTWTMVQDPRGLLPFPTTIRIQIHTAYLPPRWNRRRSRSQNHGHRYLLQALPVDTDAAEDEADSKTEEGAVAATDTTAIVVGDEAADAVVVAIVDTLLEIGLEGKTLRSLNQLGPFRQLRSPLLELLVSILMVQLWMPSTTQQWVWVAGGATSSTRCSRCSNRSITRLVIRFLTFNPISTPALLPTSGWQAWVWVTGDMVASRALTARMRQDILLAAQQVDGAGKSSGVPPCKRLPIRKAETKTHENVDSAYRSLAAQNMYPLPVVHTRAPFCDVIRSCEGRWALSERGQRPLTNRIWDERLSCSSAKVKAAPYTNNPTRRR